MKVICILLCIAMSQGSVLKSRFVREVQEIGVPSLVSLTALDPLGFEVTWKPVDDTDSYTVLGYKIKIWEQPRHKVYRYETINGVKKLVEESVPAKFSMNELPPDFEPKKVLTVDENENKANYHDVKEGVSYEIRVQAFTEDGDGPLSDPMRIEFKKANDDAHKKDIYSVS